MAWNLNNLSIHWTSAIPDPLSGPDYRLHILVATYFNSTMHSQISSEKRRFMRNSLD